MSHVIPEISDSTKNIPDDKSKPSARVIFAGQLRAIAFLSVVVVHWLGVYSLNHDFISHVTGAKNQIVGNSEYYISLLPPLPFFNYGPFGVSIFFLISGFVIPYSLRKKSKLGYLKARAIRIYPTYIICSCIMMSVYTISHFYWGSESEITPTRFLLNISLLSSLFNYESIDYINWTLSIEIKFYILCAFIYTAIKNVNLFKILSIPLLVLLVTYTTSKSNIGSSVQGGFSFDMLKIEMMYVSYMILGMLINFLFEGKIKIIKFIVSTLIVATCVLISWKIGPQSNQFIATGVNYIYGYIFFFIAYLMNRFLKENKFLSLLSELSYSFYALHAVIGYCLIRWLESIGVNYAASLAFTFSLVFALSYFVYITVEKKSIRLGKKMN